MLVRGHIAAFLAPHAKAIPLLAIGFAITLAEALTLNWIVSVIGGCFFLVVGFFTFRRSYWRNLVDERDAEITELKKTAEEKLQERAAFAEEQRDLRHELKNERDALKGLLELERAKHDLTAIYVRLDAMDELLTGRQQMFEGIAGGVLEQAQALREILEELRKRPIGG